MQPAKTTGNSSTGNVNRQQQPAKTTGKDNRQQQPATVQPATVQPATSTGNNNRQQPATTGREISEFKKIMIQKKENKIAACNRQRQPATSTGNNNRQRQPATTTGNSSTGNSSTGNVNRQQQPATTGREISEFKKIMIQKKENKIAACNRQRQPATVQPATSTGNNNRQRQPATTTGRQCQQTTGREFFRLFGKSFFINRKKWKIPKLFLVLENLENGRSSQFICKNKKNGQRLQRFRSFCSFFD